MCLAGSAVSTATGAVAQQIAGFVRGLALTVVDLAKSLWEAVVAVGECVTFQVAECGQTIQGIVDFTEMLIEDPVGTLGAIWDAYTAPIIDAWNRGEYGEAIGRTAGSIAEILLGTKGITKLRALRDARRVRVEPSVQVDLPSEARALRDRLAASGKPLAGTRNVAVARYEIDGRGGLLDAHSGQTSANGTSPVPTNPMFTPKSPDGSVVRPYDAEYKLLEELAAGISPDSKGTIYLYSERVPCGSCSSVIEQFQKAFPRIRIVVSHG